MLPVLRANTPPPQLRLIVLTAPLTLSLVWVQPIAFVLPGTQDLQFHALHVRQASIKLHLGSTRLALTARKVLTQRHQLLLVVKGVASTPTPTWAALSVFVMQDMRGL